MRGREFDSRLNQGFHSGFRRGKRENANNNYPTIKDAIKVRRRQRGEMERSLVTTARRMAPLVAVGGIGDLTH